MALVSKRGRKLVGASVAGLMTVGGVAAIAVSCGSSVELASGTNNYYKSVAVTGVPESLSNVQNKEITVWVPWNKVNASGSAVAYTQAVINWLDPKIKAAVGSKGYTVKFVGTSDNSGVGYSAAAGYIPQLINGGDAGSIPDVIVNYPDAGAAFASYSLLEDFGDVTNVAKGFKSDVTSIFLPGAQKNYVLPLAKSTDMLNFDAPAFAQLFSDLGKLKTAANADATLSVPVGSAQDRLIRIILASTTAANPVLTGIYDDADDETSGSSTDGLNQYKWADLVSAYSRKTGSGGVWELDKPVIEANFKFKGSNTAALEAIDWSKPIFTAYTELAKFAQAVVDAYTLLGGTDDQLRSYVLGYDSITNAAYSYQYAASGHNPDNFVINTKGAQVNGATATDAIKFELTNGTNAANFAAGLQWLADGINSGAYYIKSENKYGSNLAKKHLVMLSAGSSNGSFAYTDSSSTVRANADANIGDVYYDLQPGKVELSETKTSIINQGPSIMVTKIHPAVSKDIAAAIKSAFSTGFVAQTDANGKVTGDAGYWGVFGANYIYGNTESYSDGRYLDFLSGQMNESRNWPNAAGKYLYAKFLAEAETNTNFETFTNPAGNSPSWLRNGSSGIDQQFITAFAGFIGNGTKIAAGADIAAIAARNGQKESIWNVES